MPPVPSAPSRRSQPHAGRWPRRLQRGTNTVTATHTFATHVLVHFDTPEPQTNICGGEAEVALVQGGGEQGTRKTDTGVIEVFDRHVVATSGVEPPVDLVVWPEDVIDTDGAFADDPWADEVGALADALDAPMIVGTVEGDGPEHFRNGAVLLGDDGEILERYDKVHRVPFGEFVPLRSLLEPIAGDALPARDAVIGELPARLDVPGRVGRVAVAISWEVFFADRIREGVEDGARLVLNPTNGASFTGTIVQTQQVASSRMRAIETGRWVLQVAPTGFTAVVDHRGRVLDRSAISERRVLQGDVELREGVTLYTRWGNVPGLALVGPAGNRVHGRRRSAAAIARRPSAESSPSSRQRSAGRRSGPRCRARADGSEFPRAAIAGWVRQRCRRSEESFLRHPRQILHHPRPSPTRVRRHRRRPPPVPVARAAGGWRWRHQCRAAG